MTMVIAGGAIETKKVGSYLDVPFQRTARQTAKIEPEGPWVEFLAVEEDSRCPLHVVCIQAGKATVKIGVRFDALDTGFQELTLEVGNFDAGTGKVTGESGACLIEASALDPYPRTSIQDPPEYVVTLTVTEVPK